MPSQLRSSKPKDLSLTQAKRKIMDLVARRDHTETELRKKLSLRCELTIIEQAIQWAKDQNWLAKPELIQERVVQHLHNKGKGQRVINHKLRELGLEAVKTDPNLELSKAIKLVTTKWKIENLVDLEYSERQKLTGKIIRFLSSRGFDSSVTSKIISKVFKKDLSYDEEF